MVDERAVARAMQRALAVSSSFKYWRASLCLLLLALPKHRRFRHIPVTARTSDDVELRLYGEETSNAKPEVSAVVAARKSCFVDAGRIRPFVKPSDVLAGGTREDSKVTTGFCLWFLRSGRLRARKRQVSYDCPVSVIATMVIAY